MPARVQNLISPPRKAASSGSRSATSIELDAPANRRADQTNFADTLKRARSSDSRTEPQPRSSEAESKTTPSGNSERESETVDSSTVKSAEETESVTETDADSQPVEGDPQADSEGESPQAKGDEDAETESETNVATPDLTYAAAEQVIAAVPAVAPVTAMVATDDVAEAPVAADGKAIAPGAIKAVETTAKAGSATAESFGVTNVDADAVHSGGFEIDSEGRSLDGDPESDAPPHSADKPATTRSAHAKPAAEASVQPDATAPDASAGDKRPALGAHKSEADPSPQSFGQDLAPNADKPAQEAVVPKASFTIEHELKAEVTPAPQTAPRATPSTPSMPALPTPQPRLQQFAEANHDQIVTTLRTQVLAKGGAMEIRLDPPELGALQVSVKMSDGVVTASFQTSNDEATRLLSHSLGQLKHALEASGVTVDKLQVQQASRSDHDGNANDGRNSQHQEDASARQEQQRKEMIKRMWAKLSGAADPLDLVA